MTGGKMSLPFKPIHPSMFGGMCPIQITGSQLPATIISISNDLGNERPVAVILDGMLQNSDRVSGHKRRAGKDCDIFFVDPDGPSHLTLSDSSISIPRHSILTPTTKPGTEHVELMQAQHTVLPGIRLEEIGRNNFRFVAAAIAAVAEAPMVQPDQKRASLMLIKGGSDCRSMPIRSGCAGDLTRVTEDETDYFWAEGNAEQIMQLANALARKIDSAQGMFPVIKAYRDESLTLNIITEEDKPIYVSLEINTHDTRTYRSVWHTQAPYSQELYNDVFDFAELFHFSKPE